MLSPLPVPEPPSIPPAHGFPWIPVALLIFFYVFLPLLWLILAARSGTSSAKLWAEKNKERIAARRALRVSPRA